MASANNNPKPGFGEDLLACVHTVVELQARNRTGSAVTDPAYLAKLELARNNISKLLKELQTPNRLEENGNVPSDDYQMLWPSSVTDINSLIVAAPVPADDEDEDLYENTGPGSVLAARAASIAAARSLHGQDDSPPPLPPRAPVRGPASSSGAKSFSSTPSSSTSRSLSATSLRPASAAAGQTTTTACPAQGPASISSSSSTTSLSLSASAGASKLTIDERIHRLRIDRERLIKLLLDESSVKDRYYAEIEILTQQIRRIPLPSTESYSLDNEAERQKLELRAQRVQQEMEQKLGTSSECMRRREERFQAVRQVEQEIENLTEIKRTGGPDHGRVMAEHEPQVASRRAQGGLNPGPGRQHHVPRSANLEQLYHQALPMDKALSHSGPPVFGNMPLHQDDTSSVISFTSSIHSLNDASMSSHRRTREDLDTKIEFGNSLMELFGSNDADKMSRTFLAMSSSPANCDNMRSSRIIPILVQLLHGEGGTQLSEPSLAQRPSREVRFRVARALHNIVHAHPTDKQCKRVQQYAALSSRHSLVAVDKYVAVAAVAAVVGGVAAVGSVEQRRGPHLRGSGVPRYPRSKDATFYYFDIWFPELVKATIQLNDTSNIYYILLQ